METGEPGTKNEYLTDAEDKVIFASLEEIEYIINVIEKLEITRRELQKVAEGMKPIRIESSE